MIKNNSWILIALNLTNDGLMDALTGSLTGDGDSVSLSAAVNTPRRAFAHNRSISSVSVTARVNSAVQAARSSTSSTSSTTTMTRCESLDFSERMHKRSDKQRQSIRNLHQGLQHGIQGISQWTGKCGSMLARRSKTMISFARKGRLPIINLFFFFIHFFIH